MLHFIHLSDKQCYENNVTHVKIFNKHMAFWNYMYFLYIYCKNI
jgi:hypothetical protein